MLSRFKYLLLIVLFFSFNSFVCCLAQLSSRSDDINRLTWDGLEDGFNDGEMIVEGSDSEPLAIEFEDGDSILFMCTHTFRGKFEYMIFKGLVCTTDLNFEGLKTGRLRFKDCNFKKGRVFDKTVFFENCTIDVLDLSSVTINKGVSFIFENCRIKRFISKNLDLKGEIIFENCRIQGEQIEERLVFDPSNLEVLRDVFFDKLAEALQVVSMRPQGVYNFYKQIKSGNYMLLPDERLVVRKVIDDILTPPFDLPKNWDLSLGYSFSSAILFMAILVENDLDVSIDFISFVLTKCWNLLGDEFRYFSDCFIYASIAILIKSLEDSNINDDRYKHLIYRIKYKMGNYKGKSPVFLNY